METKKTAPKKPATPKTAEQRKRNRPKNLNGGRPHALKADEKTLKQIFGLGQIHATVAECAAVLGVSDPTYWQFRQDHPEAVTAYKEGAGSGKASLRRAQLKNALGGNATMQIWMGKQLLGQRDKFEHTGEGGGPIRSLALDPEKLKGMDADELAALRSALSKLGGSAGDGSGGGDATADPATYSDTLDGSQED